jgi:hypothetical protein
VLSNLDRVPWFCGQKFEGKVSCKPLSLCVSSYACTFENLSCSLLQENIGACCRIYLDSDTPQHGHSHLLSSKPSAQDRILLNVAVSKLAPQRCLQTIPHRRFCMKNRSFTALFYRTQSSLVLHQDLSSSPNQDLHAGQRREASVSYQLVLAEPVVLCCILDDETRVPPACSNAAW